MCSARCRRRWRGLAGTSRSSLPRYRGVTAGDARRAFPVTRRRRTRATSASTRRRSPTARARCSSTARTCYDRDALYGVGGVDYPGQPAAVCHAGARRARVRGARSERRAAVVHAHDWQAGLAPVYLKTLYASHPVLGGDAERLHHPQPRLPGAVRRRTGCRASICGGTLFAIDRLEFWGQISFLKGGINDADIITTVSPHVRRGDSDAGVRLRLRRHPAPPLAPIWSAS